MKTESFRRQLEDESVEGWRIKEDGDDRVIMMKPNYGSMGAHVLVALLTIWWSFGIGNALYAAYKYFGDSPTKVVRDEVAELERREAERTHRPIDADAALTP